MPEHGYPINRAGKTANQLACVSHQQKFRFFSEMAQNIGKDQRLAFSRVAYEPRIGSMYFDAMLYDKDKPETSRDAQLIEFQSYYTHGG